MLLVCTVRALSQFTMSQFTMFQFTMFLFTMRDFTRCPSIYLIYLPSAVDKFTDGIATGPTEVDMSGKGVHKGGRGQKILSKVCHACHKRLGESLFAVGMWKGNRGDRRCIACVGAKRLCGAGADAAQPFAIRP